MNKLLNFIGKIALAIVMFVSAAYLVTTAQQSHAEYLRNKVGTNVVMIKSPRGGGTGFFVNAPSGKQYILTNRHVCEMPGSLVTNSGLRIRILKKYYKADLCLMVPVKGDIVGKQGLNIASSVKVGETIQSLGHPALLPLALAQGVLLGYIKVAVGYEQASPEGTCPKHLQVGQSMFGSICYADKMSGVTNLNTTGGSSGSPVVNFWGNVVGVIYAGDNQLNWGILVPLEAVHAFMKDK